MGLDMWFREDIARILAATAETMAATQAAAPETDTTAAYRQGFADALWSVGIAFGIVVPHGSPTRPGPAAGHIFDGVARLGRIVQRD